KICINYFDPAVSWSMDPIVEALSNYSNNSSNLILFAQSEGKPGDQLLEGAMFVDKPAEASSNIRHVRYLGASHSSKKNQVISSLVEKGLTSTGAKKFVFEGLPKEMLELKDLLGEGEIKAGVRDWQLILDDSYVQLLEQSRRIIFDCAAAFLGLETKQSELS